MKASLLFLTFLSLSTTISAKEFLVAEGGDSVTYSAYANPFKSGIPLAQGVFMDQSEKNMKIANLHKLLDQQKHLYDQKISYLQDELKKSKERLIEKSINTQKIQADVEKRNNEEISYLKKELITKTKTLMEYQRQLEKVNLSDEMKNIIKSNTEIAIELRRSHDQLAIVQLQAKMAAPTGVPTPELRGRMPASIQEK